MERLIFLQKLSFNTNKSLADKKGHESPTSFAPGISLVIRENTIKLVREANETCPLLGTFPMYLWSDAHKSYAHEGMDSGGVVRGKRSSPLPNPSLKVSPKGCSY